MEKEGKIKKLEPEVYRQIAAGEVIQYPFNVVKELVENAVDAGSSKIGVMIQNGGFDMITVCDNGQGIQPDDLPLVCSQYATSKIQAFSDLLQLGTFGFRGEALFSISCTSHLSLISKTNDSEVGYQCTYSDGSLHSSTPIAAVQGTVIEVRDLFYNNRKRLYAIKSAAIQAKKIIQIITKLAIGLPDIQFKLKVDGKERVVTPGGIDSLSAVKYLFPTPTENTVFFADGNLPNNATCELVLGHPSVLKQPKLNCVFINRRLVRCERIKKAIRDVYGDYIMKALKPFFVVKIQIPPDSIDPNVHPTKSDVVFTNEAATIAEITKIIRNALEEKISTREFVKAPKITPPHPPTRLSQPIDLIERPQTSRVYSQSEDPPKPPEPLFLRKPFSLSSKLNRSDPNLRTIEEVLSLPRPQVFEEPIPIQTEQIELESIKELKNRILEKEDTLLRSVFQNLVFVGNVDLKYVLFSSGLVLFIAALFPLTRVFFFQAFVDHFANYGILTFDEPIDIKEITALVSDEPEVAVCTLMDHRDMLGDYFKITIEDGKLLSMPIVLPGYTPSFTALPVFFDFLAKFDEWDSELECITELINQLSMLYAVSEEDIRNPDITTRLTREIRDVLMPELKTDSFHPPVDLKIDRVVERIHDVAEMNTKFGR